jgi:hypothetical protein
LPFERDLQRYDEELFLMLSDMSGVDAAGR